MKTDSQKQQVLRDLSTGARLTALQALRDYGCMNLRNRISELRRECYDIRDEWRELKTKYGIKRVKEYFMVNKPVKA